MLVDVNTGFVFSPVGETLGGFFPNSDHEILQ